MARILLWDRTETEGCLSTIPVAYVAPYLFLEDKDTRCQERDIKKVDFCASMVLRPQDEGLYVCT